MIEIVRSKVIDAPIEKVWPIVRDFNALPDWHSLAVSSAIEDGKQPGEVGCIRRVVAAEGSVVREMLLGLSDQEFKCSYSIVSSPFPVTDYVGSLQLFRVTEGERTFAYWVSRFSPDAGQEEWAREFFGTMILSEGLKGLEGRVLKG